MTDRTKIYAAIAGFKRSTRAVRAIFKAFKRGRSCPYAPIDILDGRIYFNGHLVTTSAALRHNACFKRVNLLEYQIMRRRCRAIGTLY